MAVADNPLTEHHDDHHDHGEFIAHHFDSPEQQFDSGKLGIWIFLVTEVLFFSGLFVAYTLYRNHHPEIFELAHHHLDKILGCLNTIVLLFSSLTMAMAVRSAQTGKNKECEIYTLVTMVCAAVFLGVKAVEYSHKWDLGIFVKSKFAYTAGAHSVGFLGLSEYLVTLSVIPTLLLVGFAATSVIGKLTDNAKLSKFFLGLTITVGGYFLGVVGGVGYMKATESAHHDGHARVVQQQPLQLHASTIEKAGDGEDAEDTSHQHAGGEDGEHHDDAGEHGDDQEHAVSEDTLPTSVGIFFSIYYCMTGLHAIHIIAGIIALAWIYYRSQQNHWREDYFGPVDYVGLYWHLVDLIWIYLFPLLYLID